MARLREAAHQPAAPAPEVVALAPEVAGRPRAAEPAPKVVAALRVVAPRQVAPLRVVAGPLQVVAALPRAVHLAAAPALEEALVRVVAPRPEVLPLPALALVAVLLPRTAPAREQLRAAPAPPAEALARLVA